MKKMRRLFLIVLLFIFSLASLLILWPLETSPLVGKISAYVINKVNIVDVRNGAIHQDMTLLVKNGLIESITPSKDHIAHNGYSTISAEGKYIIPGLWDMHTHSYKVSPQLHHPLFIANGVTAVRGLSGCMNRKDSYWACINDKVQWTKEALNGQRVSPRYILLSSYQTNGGNEVPDGYPAFFKLDTKQHAQALVSYYESVGADFIKVYSELSEDQYNNLASATSKSEVYLAGHKPIKINLQQAIDSKQKSIEHGRLFLFECFKGIESFRNLENPISHYNTQVMWQMLNQQDSKKCFSLMSEMAQSNTWWVPTLTTLRMSAFANNADFRADRRLPEVPYIIKKLIWFPDADRAASHDPNEGGKFVHKAFFEHASQQVNAANALGVKLLAGTDAGDTYVFTGSGLHDELAMLVDAGMSPLAAIQAATISAAQFSGLENQLGSVDAGKTADLVLLNGNPLENIKNTANIFAVMQNGIYYDKTAIDKLAAFVKDQASSIHLNIRYLWDAIHSPLMRKQLAD